MGGQNLNSVGLKTTHFLAVFLLARMLLYVWHENEHEQHDETVLFATTLYGGSGLLSLGRESIAVRHEVVRFPQRRTSVV